MTDPAEDPRGGEAASCWCIACEHLTVRAREEAGDPMAMFARRFIVCPDCGNKRCPHATHHSLPCTGSNEPGQPGSAYVQVLDPPRTVEEARARILAAGRGDTDSSGECQQSDWCGPGSHCLCHPAARPAGDRAQPTRELREAVGLLDDVLGAFTEQGHPGRPCLRTGWVAVETVRAWRASTDDLRRALDGTT